MDSIDISAPKLPWMSEICHKLTNDGRDARVKQGRVRLTLLEVVVLALGFTSPPVSATHPLPDMEDTGHALVDTVALVVMAVPIAWVSVWTDALCGQSQKSTVFEYPAWACAHGSLILRSQLHHQCAMKHMDAATC